MSANDEIQRVKYYDGQFLRAVDFDAEQTYDRGARRRHVLAQHTWGIVCGFELQEVPIAGEGSLVDVVLMPGAAIDGFGRELISYHAIRLDPAAFAQFTTAAYQTIWLSYQEDDSGALSSDWADCQGSEATRTTEGWTIVVAPPPNPDDPIVVDGIDAITLAQFTSESSSSSSSGSSGSSGSSASPSPDSSPTTASAPVIPDDQSVPYQELPESSPGDTWLVRLGTVFYDGTQQGFTTAGSRLMEQRTYVGAVAGALYSPATTLDIQPRWLPENPQTSDYDGADFANVAGRLKVMGRINAEQDVWIDGGKIHFAYAGSTEDNAPITLGREVPASGSGNLLRLRLGSSADPSMMMSIGPGDAADTSSTPSDIVEITGDDVVTIPTGTLSFAEQTRQMVDLYASGTGHQYGIGVQSDTAAGPTALYQRSDASFRWFKGGTHDDKGTNGGAGAGGQLQLELDPDGNLLFGDPSHAIGTQLNIMYFRSDANFCWYTGGTYSSSGPGPGASMGMRLDSALNLQLFTGGLQFFGGYGEWLNLYGSSNGIGVQASATYFRSNQDFCWFRGGTHSDIQDDPGTGGTQTMRLDGGGNLYVSGKLVVTGDAPSVITAKSYELILTNPSTTSDQPATGTQDVSSDFTEVYTAFAVLSGFSVFPQTGVPTQSGSPFNAPGHDSDVNAIPQNVYARVTGWSSSPIHVFVEGFCSESLESNQGDSSVFVTLVVIGRNA